MGGMPAADGVQGAPGSRTRASCETSDESSWARFLVRKPTYAPQYAQIYFCRLASLRPRVRAAAEAAWDATPGSPDFADRILAAAGSADHDAAVCGVLYRELPAKPSILAEYGNASVNLIPAPPVRSLSPYVTDTDGGTVSLEDETGRITLDVADVRAQFDNLATGVVVAVRGRENRKTGEFKVSGVVSAGLAPQKPMPELPSDRYVCLVSGLGLGNPGMSALPSELLLEYLRANIGDEEEETFSASVVHLIIAGNLVSSPTAASRSSTAASALLKPHLPVNTATALDFAAPMVLGDRFLTAAAASLPVSVMPGEHDPVNSLLPQQPFHRCLLPNASRESNLLRVTNPYECSLDGRTFLGTSGQNVHDYVLYNTTAARSSAIHEKASNGDAQPPSRSGNENGENNVNPSEDKMDVDDVSTPPDAERVIPHKDADISPEPSSASVGLGVLETMVLNRHVCPTAPDTLGSYPFYDSDPFILDSTPHVFFSGNQPEFGVKMLEDSSNVTSAVSSKDHSTESLKKVCLLSLPRFDLTGIAVLVNLRTLACTTVQFQDSLG